MSTTYAVVGQATTYEGRCEAWVEQQLLGHQGVYANALAAQSASDFVATSDPNAVPANVAVVFGAAASNGGQGHTGVSLGGGRFESVWTDGSVVQESIAQFVTDNGAPLLGYHNFGRGVPGSLSHAVATTLPAPLAAGFSGLSTPAKAAAALFGFGVLWWLLD